MKKRKYLNVMLSLIVAIGFAACASNSEKASVYLRNDVDTAESKIVAFPMLLWDGKKLSAANVEYSNPIVDAAIGKSWSDYIGADRTVSIPKLVLDKIPMANEAVDAIVKGIDDISALEQSGILESAPLKTFLNAIDEKFGHGALAFALVNETKEGFEKSKTVQVNMGLFDTKKMTWKWITKHKTTIGVVPIPYEKVVQDLVSESFKALLEKNKGKAS